MKKNFILGATLIACIIAAAIIAAFLFFHPNSSFRNEKSLNNVSVYTNNIITEEKNNNGRLNGYKGYHYARIGYQQAGDGWWYPPTAFISKN